MVALMKNRIQSIGGYNQKMAASMAEKTFFFDHIEDDDEVLIDFGCANAVMLERLRASGLNIEYVGYDMNPEMVYAASKSASEKRLERFAITSSWDDVESKIKGKRACLLLSSVIHEVYSYGTKEDVNIFWSRVLGGAFSKVFVRDMMYSQKMSRFTSVAEVQKITRKFSPFLIKQWELQWGPLLELKSMLHFLLTYHYLDNWTREYLENYFPISCEEFAELVEKSRYHMSVFYPHKVPYLENKISLDFGIKLQENTHIVAVLTRQ